MNIGMRIVTKTKTETGKMNQFRIKCSEVNYFTVLVEADSEAAAVTMANANINAFEVEDEYTSEWTIEEVEEL